MIIVFDGLCNFCNGWAQFVLRRDRLHRFQFAAAQSDEGAELLRSLGLPSDRLETIVLIDDQRSYQKSDAVLQILKHLGWLWLVSRVLSLVPRDLRDACYSAFARRRYKWFGKSDTCPTLDVKWRNRFMSLPRVTAQLTMRLSVEELTRLDVMFASGQVRSDPAIASATDRLLDAMQHAAQERVTTRRLRLRHQADKQAGLAAATAHEPNDFRQKNDVDAAGPQTAQAEVDWNLPRPLDELIRIRRALLRNDLPSL